MRDKLTVVEEGKDGEWAGGGLHFGARRQVNRFQRHIVLRRRFFEQRHIFRRERALIRIINHPARRRRDAQTEFRRLSTRHKRQVEQRKIRRRCVGELKSTVRQIAGIREKRTLLR